MATGPADYGPAVAVVHPPLPGLAAPAMIPAPPEHLQSVRAAVLAKAESLRAGSRPVLWVVCRWRLSYIYTAQAKSGGP